MQNTKNPLIFVVEDNPIYNELITGVLRSKRFKNIHSYKGTEECLTKIELNPDVIVLNYAYSGMTGLDLMRKVHETKPWVNFIFLSGQNDIDIAVKIVRHGAFDYIIKNDKAPEKLIASINEITTTARSENVKKGLRKGGILFFIVLFIALLIMFAITIFIKDFQF